ncbi:unnamed protein product [Parajaminaea phylloscopi]
MAMTGTASVDQPVRFIDIGVNLTDPVFCGSYHGKQAHPADLDTVLGRARAAGVVGQIVTGGSLSESKEALDLCAKEQDLYATVGCHPTRSGEFDSYAGGPEAYKEALAALISESSANGSIASKGKGKAVAVGECGLDYDRLHFSSAEVQRKYFAVQLELAERFALPLFLHSRAAADDFVEILQPWLHRLASATQSSRPFPALPEELREAHGSASAPHRAGVVHSFTGTLQEAQQLVQLGLFIGINGCSLKTEENLEVVKAIPLDRMLLETDAPWCDLRPTHAGTKLLSSQQVVVSPLYAPPSVKKEKYDADKTVKGRNEPCAIGHVATVVATLKGLDVATVGRAVEANTRWLFDL